MNFFKWFTRKFQEISTARGRIKGLTIIAELKRLFHEISIFGLFLNNFFVRIYTIFALNIKSKTTVTAGF
jgi:hypothetical protein